MSYIKDIYNCLGAFPCLTGLRPPFGQMVRQDRLTPLRTLPASGQGTPSAYASTTRSHSKVLAGDMTEEGGEAGTRPQGRAERRQEPLSDPAGYPPPHPQSCRTTLRLSARRTAPRSEQGRIVGTRDQRARPGSGARIIPP